LLLALSVVIPRIYIKNFFIFIPVLNYPTISNKLPLIQYYTFSNFLKKILQC
jgi:hypothetical protein